MRAIASRVLFAAGMSLLPLQAAMAAGMFFIPIPAHAAAPQPWAGAASGQPCEPGIVVGQTVMTTDQTEILACLATSTTNTALIWKVEIGGSNLPNCSDLMTIMNSDGGLPGPVGTQVGSTTFYPNPWSGTTESIVGGQMLPCYDSSAPQNGTCVLTNTASGGVASWSEVCQPSNCTPFSNPPTSGQCNSMWYMGWPAGAFTGTYTVTSGCNCPNPTGACQPYSTSNYSGCTEVSGTWLQTSLVFSSCSPNGGIPSPPGNYSGAPGGPYGGPMPVAGSACQPGGGYFTYSGVMVVGNNTSACPGQYEIDTVNYSCQ